jgi:hypothetical protein
MNLSVSNPICVLWAMLLFQGNCVADEQILKDKIVRATLDHNELAVVRVGTTGVTSLEFPYKIEAIDGYGFSATPGSGDAFQISYTKGTNYFSVRALKTGVTGNLTVVLDQKLYSIFFEESSDPSFVNIFSPSSQDLAEASLDQIDAAKNQAPTSGQLAGLLDTVKHYETLRTTHPEMLEGLYVTEPGKQISLGKDIASTIHRVLEDKTLGSIAFEVEIANRSQNDFCYDPATLQIKVQDRDYNAALQEASGIVKAGASEIVFLVVSESVPERRAGLVAAGEFGFAVRAKALEQDPEVTFDQPAPNYLPTAMTVAKRGETPEPRSKEDPVEASPDPRSTPSVVKRTVAKKAQKKSEPKPDADPKNSSAKVQKPAPKKLFGWL